MTGTDEPGVDLASTRPGDCLEARHRETVLHQGIIEVTAPSLGVVWIRETGTGARKMLSTADVDLRLC